MRRFSILLGAALLCAPFAAYATAAGQSAQSAGSKEDLSVLAGKMLEETNQARKAIQDKNSTSALQDVERAQAELRQIEARAHGATMIPVYQEFVSISMLQPVIAEQNGREANENRQSAKAGEQVVHQVSGDYTDVAVSTTVAQQNLATAKTALQQKSFQLADKALADVQQGVSMQMIEANMPLAKARENLILARSAAEKGDYAEVHAALQSASKALATYASAGRPHSADANSLKQQIDSYDKSVQQNHEDVVAKINGWWNTTSSWTPYQGSGQMSASR
jgi:flagellin-specific chaperone FliS